MEFLTATILSGIVYDIIKTGVVVTATHLKEKLRSWSLSQDDLVVITAEIDRLKIDRNMSEFAIEEALKQSSPIQQILGSGKTQVGSITQIHYGQGDNVGRDKNIV